MSDVSVPQSWPRWAHSVSHTRVTVERGINSGLIRIATQPRTADAWHHDSCRPRGVVTRDFSAIFDRLFDRLPVRISTSDLHHWILRKKIFHIRAYDFGVQFSFNHPHASPPPLPTSPGAAFFFAWSSCQFFLSLSTKRESFRLQWPSSGMSKRPSWTGSSPLALIWLICDFLFRRKATSVVRTITTTTTVAATPMIKPVSAVLVDFAAAESAPVLKWSSEAQIRHSRISLQPIDSWKAVGHGKKKNVFGAIMKCYNENRYAWTDEGRADLWKIVLIFEKPKVLPVLVGP